MVGPPVLFSNDMPSSSQTYCLRWNNHKTNLVEILTALLRIESYVDCTIVVDENVQFKAHRVVLAANSPYFQSILQGQHMDHSIIICPGVKATEMRILLEYMYTGSANVTKEQIPRIMRIAVELEIKGLYDMVDVKDRYKRGFRFNEVSAFHHYQPHCSFDPIMNGNRELINSTRSSSYQDDYRVNSTSSNGPSSSSSPNQEISPYRNGDANSYDHHNGRSAYEVRSPAHIEAVGDGSRYSSPWQITSSGGTAIMTSAHEAGSDMNPVKRKKISSMSVSDSDTPILRNVLAKTSTAGDESSSSAGTSADMPSVSSNGRAADVQEPIQIDISSSGNEEELTAASPEDAPNGHNPEDNDDVHEEVKSEPSESSDAEQSVEEEAVVEVPRPTSKVNPIKPEWKRYKQYTRHDIQSAIQCVRDGMSALQASRKFGVPARTLYDKVKKLGITTSRLSNRGKRGGSPNDSKGTPVLGNSPGTSFVANNYATATTMAATAAVAAAAAMYEGVMSEQEAQQLQQTITNTTAAALLDPMFLQQAIESHANADISGCNALHAMALAAAAHAAMHSASTSSNEEHSSNNSGSDTQAASPYAGNGGEVEDLSINRTPRSTSKSKTSS